MKNRKNGGCITLENSSKLFQLFFFNSSSEKDFVSNCNVGPYVIAVGLSLLFPLLGLAHADGPCPQNDTSTQPVSSFNADSLDTAADAASSLLPGAPAASKEKRFGLHAQTTFVPMGDLPFHSPYSGGQSLTGGQLKETWDFTVLAGARLWKGNEVWANGEVEQGFGLSDTYGVAGYPSGEAYKVGAEKPYLKLPRLFVRQTFNLGGESEHVDGTPNQMTETQTKNRLVLTAGKFSVTDIFDNNQYAHDPRGDFMNWSLIDLGSFDYAANAWGQTYGASAELYQGRFAARVGEFAMSTVPNSPDIDTTGQQRQTVGEFEEDHKIGGKDGDVKVFGYMTQARMGDYDAAIEAAQGTGQPPNMAGVRKQQATGGAGVNFEQEITKKGDGVFARAGMSDPKQESFDFTDIKRSVSGGVSVSGTHWRQDQDTFGLGVAVNSLGKNGYEYLNAGGMGILVGDGQLPHPGSEKILEMYYDHRFKIVPGAEFRLDYQHVDNPGYNEDRGPANIGGASVHWGK